MKGIYVQRGECIEYTADTAIAAGEVVDLVTRIGIAAADIAAGAAGGIHVTGVFALPKAAEEIAVGAAVFLGDDGITASAEGNTPAGYAAAAATAEDTLVKVKLLG